MTKWYFWQVMKNGKLLGGMYCHSPLAASEKLARLLAMPSLSNVDAYALIETPEPNYSGGVIIDIVNAKEAK